MSVEIQEETDISHVTNNHREHVEREKDDLVYGIEDNPSFLQQIILSLQLFMSVFAGNIWIPLLLGEILCMETEVVVISKIISATFLMQGVITLLQATFGVRLPIIQGSSFSYIPPSIALVTFYGECTQGEGLSKNETTGDHIWKETLAEINGGLLVASAIEVIIGVTGLVTLIRRFVGPLSIAPVLILLGISLCQVSWKSCQVHWGVSLFTAALIVIFSQLLNNKKVPMLSFSKEKGFHVVRTRLFLKFSMFLAIMSSWFLCFILTVSGFLPDDPSARTYRTRTDIGNEAFNNTGWITFPYPGQIVWPRPTLAASFGMLAAVIASIVESLGDYSACAAICDVPTPPDHAINRGIAVQGLGGVLSCIWGTGTGTGSYSAPIVIIGITKVASRRVVQGVGVFFIMMGFLQVLSSFFATIPSPVLGGTLIAKTGMIISIGISLLQKVNLSSSRNLFVLGLSLFFGIVMPEYLKQTPNAINTGSPTFNTSATILLETGIFVGFVTGVVFDNLIPGSLVDRGLGPRIETSGGTEADANQGQEVKTIVKSCYNLPVGMNLIRRSRYAAFFPLSPTFRGFSKKSRQSSYDQVCEKEPMTLETVEK